VRRRLLAATLAVVAVSVFSLGLPLLVVTVRLVADSARTELLRQVQTVAAVVEDPTSSGAPTAERLTRLVPPGEQVTIRAADGRTTTAGPDPGPSPYTAQAPLPRGGDVQVARPADDVRGRQYRFGFGVVAGMAGSAVLAAIAAVLLARRLAEPLRDVAGRAARLGAGDYRVSPARPGIERRHWDVDRAFAKTWARDLGYGRQFRLALMLQNRFGLERLLAHTLGDRFELLVNQRRAHLVFRERFTRQRPKLGENRQRMEFSRRRILVSGDGFP